jgi:hypothetical protein
VAKAVGEAVIALQTISDDAGAAGDKVALLDALAPPRRGRNGFNPDAHFCIDCETPELVPPVLRRLRAEILRG